MSSPSTSVVVVSYRPGDWLRPCLESVLDQADEVVVVDNASAGREAARTAAALGTRVVTSRRNLGFAGGAGLGLAAASGEIVAVLNDDAVAEPGWLTSAATVLADPLVAAVTPKVVLAGSFAEVVLDDEEWFAPGDARPLGRQVRSVTSDGEEVLASCLGAGLHELEGPAGSHWRWTAGSRPFYVPVSGPGHEVRIDGAPVGTGPTVRLLNHAGSFLRHHGIGGEYGLGAPDDGRFDQPREPFGFSGTAPVFRAETLRHLGGFARPFFAYNEDTDWCLRARLRGLRIAYDPGGTVVHRLSATSGGTAAEAVRRLSQRNALLCLVRNAPAGLARREVRQRLERGWRDPVVGQTVARLPWAVGTRVLLSRRWVETPERMWECWADADMAWDASPARV